MNLVGFIDRFRGAIADAVIQAYPPLYTAETRRTCGFDLGRLLRRPMGGQADAIRATALSIQRHRGTNVVGEAGCGKTLIATASAYLSGCRRVLVFCPPHLVRKWRREVLATVPCAKATVVRTITDLECAVSAYGRSAGTSLAAKDVKVDAGSLAAKDPADRELRVVVCSREQAKLGYRWVPAAVLRPVRADGGGLARLDDGSLLRRLCCPACFTPILDDEGTPLERADLAARKRRCTACGGPLWQADRTGPRRFALADYVRDRLPGYFDLLIVDECHEAKARGAAQGLAASTLSEACAKTLTLTGTLYGGYASTLFHLLWRFAPRGAGSVRAEFAHGDEFKWVSRYGILERITKKESEADEPGEDGRRSKRRSFQTRTVEKPGVSPAILLHLIPNTVFLRLADVARDLPPYTEHVALVGLDRTALIDGDIASQAAAYRRLASELRQAVSAALQQGSKRLLGAYLQSLLSYPDACTREETVVDPVTARVLGHAPALPEDVLYPKERALLELLRERRSRGRRVLIYVTHTQKRDITPRLTTLLAREGFRVAVLKADTVAPDRREDWVAARVREGIDALVVHPRLVQTGLDLIDFPSICWYEVEYSVYVMRQASRRSWRIGQRLPVDVTFFAYAGTLQAEALALVAAKMRSALMVEGELPEDGLAALQGDAADVLLSLARRLVAADAGALGDAPPEMDQLEALFAQAREAATAGEEFLVDGSWTEESESHEPAPALAAVRGQDAPPPVGGGLISLDDLAHLAGRPKRRARPVPAGQLTLFGADAA